MNDTDDDTGDDTGADDVLARAGRWYLDVLAAIESALVDIAGLDANLATDLAPRFIAHLARNGYIINETSI